MTMRRVAALIALTLAGCAGAQETFDLSVADARQRILDGTYPKGSIANFSSHNIRPTAAGEDRITWKIVTDDGLGFPCESTLTPANAEGTQALVKTECATDNNPLVEEAKRSLKRLIDSVLTGKPYSKTEI